MIGIEEAIDDVERLYRTVTGQDLPSSGEPYAPIPAEKNPEEYVTQQVDRLSAMLGASTGVPRPVPVQTPSMSIWETDSEMIVCVDLPGVDREQLHVQTIGRTLHVSAQPRRPSSSARLSLAERAIGPFHRVIGLPEDLRADSLSAKMSDGLLEIRVPKSASTATAARDVPVL